MKRFIRYCFLAAACIPVLYISCKTGDSEAENEDAPAATISPVTITHPRTGNLSETAEVNAVSAFLLKTYAKANANGYLQASHVNLGNYVRKGQTLFVIETKEAAALGNTINQLDTSLHFEGTIRVTAPGNGYITQLTYTSGNYVQDGEQLAEITDTRSFVFLLDLPYELKPYLPLNQTVELHLPDSTVLTGKIQSPLPIVDSISQTQRYIIKVAISNIIPEHLIAKVRLLKKIRPNTTILPKSALLSDETQAEFWIMQLMNDSIAVKVPVQKGLETAGEVEILSPELKESTRILLTGNYGLPDTANVKVLNPE